ncbi:MAG: potassium transporter TrkH [Rhodospirillaceae bacterium]|jgi:trk system potassium uptake protein TrkH|nr:potassium transporter TrkH [Rhodospirillaceae bacterium]|tara:strand:- start:6370 stop:7815 length:1446 start_codon:yes stop_codon:yes gene_type:complete
MDFRPIFLVIGILLATLALIMLIPAAVDFLAGNPDWEVFAISSGVTLFVGVAMALTSRAGVMNLSIRQAFLMTTLSWLTLTFFASLPFVYSQLGLGFTDAFFEAMSGITTTGSTVIIGLDGLTTGILLWRALLQWLGGIGIIVMAIAVLPILKVGGMQLFRMESSDQSEKALPRTAQIASAIGVIYLLLTVACAGAYWLAGMNGFEAFAHAMTTIATGGFSTSDGSIGYFDSAWIDSIATVFMIIGALPFLLYLRTLQGNFSALFSDSQVQWFLSMVAAVVIMSAGWLWLENGLEPVFALRLASFNTVSIITGTGYATSDFSLWGSFALPIFFFIMFIGGCAGSTTCGIKVFRFQVLYAAARTQIHHLLQPHGVFIPYYNRRPISDEVIVSVLSFFFMWFLSFSLLALALGMLGLDFLTAFSAAASAIANVGPALGPIVGPSGTFQSLSDEAKWLLSGGMLLGRLELFTVIVLFSRSFWRG